MISRTVCLSFALCVLALLSPGLATGEDNSSGELFYFKPIQWSFSIPEGWEKRTVHEVSATRNRGRTLIESAASEKMTDEDFKTAAPVLYLKKGENNKFSSDVQAYSPIPGKSYEARQKELFDFLIQTFRTRFKQVNQKRSTETIDGVRFARLEIELRSPDGKHLLGYMNTFDAKIGNLTFQMSAVSKTKEEQKQILRAMRASTFSKPAKSQGSN